MTARKNLIHTFVAIRIKNPKILLKLVIYAYYLKQTMMIWLSSSFDFGHEYIFLITKHHQNVQPLLFQVISPGFIPLYLKKSFHYSRQLSDVY